MNPVAWALAQDLHGDVWYLLAFVDDKALVYATYTSEERARWAYHEVVA